MGKETIFDGKVGSFGLYGGTQIKNAVVSNTGYYAKECCICKQLALYYVGKDGFCKDHRDDAVEELSKVGKRGNYNYVPPVEDDDPDEVLDPDDIKLLRARVPIL